MTDEDDEEDRLLSGWNSLRKKDHDRFRVGRNGDGRLVSFECDWCIFHKLYRRNPSSGSGTRISDQDKFSMSCIRHINLDAF